MIFYWKGFAGRIATSTGLGLMWHSKISLLVGCKMVPPSPRMLCDLLAIRSGLETSERCPNISLSVFAAQLVAGPAKGGRGGGLAATGNPGWEGVKFIPSPLGTTVAPCRARGLTPGCSPWWQRLNIPPAPLAPVVSAVLQVQDQTPLLQLHRMGPGGPAPPRQG